MVITGRVPSSWAVTQSWFGNYFGEESLSKLNFVANNLVESLFAEGKYTEASQELAVLKRERIQKLGVQVHFDNNGDIVQGLRDAGIMAIQYGGRAAASAQVIREIGEV